MHPFACADADIPTISSPCMIPLPARLVHAPGDGGAGEALPRRWPSACWRCARGG
ncbi:hypothetical protein ACU4GD_39165 [Cupriavidus basilensis]